MSEGFVLNLARETIYTLLLTASPVLLISLLVGLGISIFQAATQVQEPTLTFVPKIVAVFIAVLVFGTWMLNLLITFTMGIFDSIPAILH